MRLSSRLAKLEMTLAPAGRRYPELPGDPAAFARALLAGEFTVDDVDPTHPDHTGWLCRVHAFLITLSDGHQAWLRAQREIDPRSYPGGVLLPATDEEILAELDATMRRG